MRVSVLLPYRDAALTLEEAVSSILAQSEPSLELLAVDDGSRDDGPERLARMARADRRVIPLRAPGRGIAAALELARASARAPYLMRMDADDVSAPDRLHAQLALLEREPRVAAVGTQVELFPADAVADGMRRYVAWQNAIVTPEAHARALFIESPLCHPSVMLRRDALAAVGGWREGPWPEDYDLWLRLDAAGHGLAKVPHPLLRWRQGPGRATITDPRYRPERFRALKAAHLARRLGAIGRPLCVWGAGPTGKRLARALEEHGVVARQFVDIDPRKVGGRARAAPVVSPTALVRGELTVVVAVGTLGAREEIAGFLEARGFVEGADYLCAA
jgi:glycosyltransferase involved in cell wall biosynthesis